MGRVAVALMMLVALSGCASVPGATRMPNPIATGRPRANRVTNEHLETERDLGLPRGSLVDAARLAVLDERTVCFAVELRTVAGVIDPLTRLRVDEAVGSTDRLRLGGWTWTLETADGRTLSTAAHIRSIAPTTSARFDGLVSPAALARLGPAGHEAARSSSCDAISIGGQTFGPAADARAASYHRQGGSGPYPRPVRCEGRADDDGPDDPAWVDVATGGGTVCLEHGGSLGAASGGVALRMVRRDDPSDALRWRWVFAR